MKKLYVGNLLWTVSVSEIKEAFAPYGKVNTVRIINGDNGKSRGFAFIEMDNAEQADLAMAKLDQAKLKGRPMNINVAVDKPKK